MACLKYLLRRKDYSHCRALEHGNFVMHCQKQFRQHYSLQDSYKQCKKESQIPVLH